MTCMQYKNDDDMTKHTIKLMHGTNNSLYKKTDEYIKYRTNIVCEVCEYAVIRYCLDDRP